MKIRVVQTNESRRSDLRDRRNARARSMPLMRLGMWVWSHRHDIQGAPRELLLGARGFVLARGVLLDQATESSRTRQTRRWLTRWQSLIEQELDRQGAGLN